MINSYQGLQQLVKQKRLEIIYVIAPPRTMSTVIHIALTQSCDGQIMEPFNLKKRDGFNEGCQLILNRVNQIFDEKGRWPIRLVIKDIAKNIKFKEWQSIKNIFSYCVFTVREPTLSLSSLLIRRANDYDSNELSYSAVIRRAESLSKEYWHDISWRKIDRFLTDVEEEFNYRFPVSIISSLSLCLDPIGTMRKLSVKFGWKPFNHQLVKDWQKAIGTDIYSPPYINQDPITYKKRFFRNTWIKKAIWSTSFKPLDQAQDSPRDIGQWPKKMQKYLLEEVLPVYVRFVGHDFNDSRPPIRKVNKLIKINPLEAYVLLSTYKNLKPNEEKIRKNLLNKASILLKDLAPIIFLQLEKIKINSQ